MDYGNYKVEDLLMDNRFVNYCLRSNDGDIAHWERTLRDHPQLADRAEEARQLVLLMAVKVDERIKQEELRRLKTAMGGAIDKSIHLPGIRRLSQTAKRWLAVAAAVLMFGCVYLLSRSGNAVDHAIAFALEQARPDTVAVTGLGERQRVTLPDGSTVMLNGSSQLRVASGFNETHRVVWLEGDAFFEVAKQQEKPFVVRTATMVTTALGTSFRVSNYATLNEPYVMLATGKVKVNPIVSGKPTATTVLSPGQMAVLGGDGRMDNRTFDETTLNAWLERTLIFQGAGLAEIKAKLLDVYGVSLIADTGLTNTIAFTGQFINRPLAEVLDAIAFSNRVQFKLSEDRIYMIP